MHIQHTKLAGHCDSRRSHPCPPCNAWHVRVVPVTDFCEHASRRQCAYASATSEPATQAWNHLQGSIVHGGRAHASRRSGTWRVHAAAATSPGASMSQGPGLLPQLKPGDLIRTRPLPAAATDSTDGFTQGDVYLEVITGWDERAGSCTAVCEGRLLKLSLEQNGQLRATHQGSRLGPPLTATFPSLSKLSPRLSSPLPWTQLSLADAQVVCNLADLEQQVRDNPPRWCGGTAPGDPLPTGVDYQVQSAGELLSLLCGWRGVAMVQLWAGWDAAVPQPVLNPFVMTLLARVTGTKDVAVVTSTVSGGLGVTALIHANKEPFRSWAKHMASFGAQAALVAGSPFYQLLIGRMLGYQEANIHHHIRSQSGAGAALTPQVIAAVDAEMMKISGKKPVLPWNTSSRGKAKQK